MDRRAAERTGTPGSRATHTTSGARPAIRRHLIESAFTASNTARMLVAAGLGPLHLCASLKEINCGALDGLAIGEVQRRVPQLWRENCRQDREELGWPGGESYRELRNRCVAAMNSIAAAHPCGRVAVVTHAGVISQIVGSICAVSPARWGLFRPANASVTEVVWRGSSGVVVSFDCRPHLRDASKPFTLSTKMRRRPDDA